MQAAAEWGLKTEHFAQEVTWLWSDNVAAVNLFCRVRTQWRVGPGGAVGLDYNVVMRFMDRLDLGSAEYDQMMEDIATMERAAINIMQTQK